MAQGQKFGGPQWVETEIGFYGIAFIAEEYGFHILEGANDSP